MFNKIVKDLINKLISEFNKDENKYMVEKEIMNPLIKNFIDRIYPYVSILFIMFSLNLLLIILILILIIYKKKFNFYFLLMNKLVNLFLIFLILNLYNFINVNDSILVKNIIITSIIGVFQFIYNYFLKLIKRKDTNFKTNIMDSLFKMIVVFGGLYIFDDIKESQVLLNSNHLYRPFFVTLLITFFILLKCLTKP